jgi:hypothetical protein
MSAARACIEDLRAQGFKPKGEQLDAHWLVRIRGLFVDYTASTLRPAKFQFTLNRPLGARRRRPTSQSPR